MEFQPEDVIAEFRARGARAPAARSRLRPDSDAVEPPRHRLEQLGRGRLRARRARYPILANDPHRASGARRCATGCTWSRPGWNVIGGGEPVLPGVSIGHNEHGAWGLTIFGNDSEDLYVYDTNPANPNEYRYQGRWEAMRVVARHDSGQGREAGRRSS